MTSIHVRGFTFDYDDAGSKDHEAVIALHGFPQDRTSWRDFRQPVIDADFRWIAIDQRGYSPLARPRKVAAYRMSELVADVLAICDELQVSRFHVIGHDWGGGVAWALASVAPQRLRSLTVLSTPHPAALTSVAWRSDQLAKSWYMAAFQLPALPERLLTPGSKAWQQLTRGLPEDVKTHYWERAVVPGALTAMLNWYRALPQDLLQPSVKLHRCPVSTLYVWGRRDPALGSAAALKTADYVTGSYTFTALARAGHWLPETEHERILPLFLDHLGRHRDPSHLS